MVDWTSPTALAAQASTSLTFWDPSEMGAEIFNPVDAFLRMNHVLAGVYLYVDQYLQ